MRNKRVHIIATGGTITSKPKSSTAMIGYTQAFTAEDLLRDLPEAREVAEISVTEMFNKPSPLITDADMLQIALEAQRISDEGLADGLVVLVGTDTMEEVAYFLHLTVHSELPLVVTGSMRPPGVLSADGALNLLNAIHVAADEQCRGFGTMVVMNELIVCAREATKTSGFKVEAFDGGRYGVIGFVRNGEVLLYYRSLKRYGMTSRFSCQDLPDELPRVDILYLYQGCDVDMMKAAFTLRPEALVIAGMGNGIIHRSMRDHCLSIPADERPILIRSTRVEGGSSFGDYGNFDADIKAFPAGDILPPKARMLARLALTQTKSVDEIKAIFKEY